MAATCPAEHGTIVNTSEDKQRCEENSKVVDTLEDIFTAHHLKLGCWELVLIWTTNTAIGGRGTLRIV
ncbi:hypothetical protein B0H13DRAFT_2394714 [Mycena leptocephala]|nr:hypothetical protein B0H13DRAFT_2394714 [Mycena leptocephala]